MQSDGRENTTRYKNYNSPYYVIIRLRLRPITSGGTGGGILIVQFQVLQEFVANNS